MKNIRENGSNMDTMRAGYIHKRKSWNWGLMIKMKALQNGLINETFVRIRNPACKCLVGALGCGHKMTSPLTFYKAKIQTSPRLNLQGMGTEVNLKTSEFSDHSEPAESQNGRYLLLSHHQQRQSLIFKHLWYFHETRGVLLESTVNFTLASLWFM